MEHPKVAFSDEADVNRAKLPSNLRRIVEEFLARLADNPEAPGTLDSEDFQGVGIDGSYFAATAYYTFREDDLFVDDIDFLSH